MSNDFLSVFYPSCPATDSTHEVETVPAYLGGGWMDVVLGKARSPMCLMFRSTYYPPFVSRLVHSTTSASIC